MTEKAKSKIIKEDAEGKLSEKERLWLIKKAATEVEINIYKMMLFSYRRTKEPLQNFDISKARRTNRTGTLVHLNNMVKKGLIKKSGRFNYIPIDRNIAAGLKR